MSRHSLRLVRQDEQTRLVRAVEPRLQIVPSKRRAASPAWLLVLLVAAVAVLAVAS